MIRYPNWSHDVAHKKVNGNNFNMFSAWEYPTVLKFDYNNNNYNIIIVIQCVIFIPGNSKFGKNMQLLRGVYYI